MYVDAHCHLDDAAFDADRDAVIERARGVGVTGFVVAGVDPGSWGRQRALAAGRAGVIWTAGLHPVAAARAGREGAARALEGLAGCFEGAAAARGVGETGLDTRFAPRESLALQIDCLREQLALARELDRPVVLHVVGPGTHARVLEVLRRDGLPAAGGMVHMYGGSAELVAEYVALGLHLSFGGPVARPEARKLHRAAPRVPGDRLLVETDAPDLAPPGGPARNEPALLPVVARALAALRGEDAEGLLARAADNARALFGGLDAAGADDGASTKT